MKIAIASDHAGVTLKSEICKMLLDLGHEVKDFGTYSAEARVDYPDMAFLTAESVAAHKYDRGVLICGTGIGMMLAANKVQGIRAALCHDQFTALLSRRHNDSNIIVLGARVTGMDVAKEMVKAWLVEPFEGGRHSIRLQKITSYEQKPNTMLNAGAKGGRTIVFDHPLVRHKLAVLRDKATAPKDFRELVKEITSLMVYEVTRDLPVKEEVVETPLKQTTVFKLADSKIAVVPILRAGLGMLDGFLSLVPNATIGHIGLYRDPDSLKPVEYYSKYPADITTSTVFILDPMLATGGTVKEAISMLKKIGVKSISVISIIAVPQGIDTVHEAHPDVDIFVAAIDENLNDYGYIVPGLGDISNRLFAAK
ncbi:MAG: uracil phosphoribosyltransferase [Synergistaceae bacterium]|nr:uracil phosphoribosyltransferase [Synergistaceae bacterium]